MKNRPENIIVHHSGSPRDTTTFKGVNAYHRRRWNFRSALGFYIGYHLFIEADGSVHKGRLFDEAGAHTKDSGMNFKSIGVCLAGNFNNELPTHPQAEATRAIIAVTTPTFPRKTSCLCIALALAAVVPFNSPSFLSIPSSHFSIAPIRLNRLCTSRSFI